MGLVLRGSEEERVAGPGLIVPGLTGPRGQVPADPAAPRRGVDGLQDRAAHAAPGIVPGLAAAEGPVPAAPVPAAPRGIAVPSPRPR